MKKKNILFFLQFIFLFILKSTFCDKHPKEEWKSRSIYQILTDRFAKTGEDSKIECSDLTKYCGGTFKGIQQNLDYISGMGFNAIWISPPLKNKENSYHGYHNIDLNSINENFGTEDDLKQLIKECHKRDIWVILDAVPNHMAGDLDISTFIPFNKEEYYHENCDVQENSSQEEKENCRIWGMPDLKQENEFVKNTLLKWIKDIINNYGFDGVRYADVANVPKWFWKEFTKEADTYTLGIVSSNDVDYIADYQNYMDGVGDYPLFYSIRESFCGSMLKLQDYNKNIHKKYINIVYNGIWLGNHDNSRFLNECPYENLLRNAIIFTLFYEGIPIFYYGDEQYFKGKNEYDKQREVMFGYHDTSSDAYKLIKIANEVRKSELIYEHNLKEIYADEKIYAFTRGDVLIIVSNYKEEEIKNDYINIDFNEFDEGDKLCNQIIQNDCIFVQNRQIKIKLDGEPKLYVKDVDKKNNSNMLSIVTYLSIFLIILV